MKERLAIGMVQADLIWQSPADNRDLIAKIIANQSIGLDLIVLPETFTTGFTKSAEEFAEPMEGPTLAWMAEQAALHDVHITGSYLVEEHGCFYNRLIWMQQDGNYGVYDKRHLFTMAGEHRVFSAGDKRLIMECRGWRCCPMICYDLRFPVWSRSRADYDLLLYVANWPEPRGPQWNRLLPARAIENQAYVVGVNRVGLDGEGFIYGGDTQCYDPLGEPMVENDGGEEMLRVEISALSLARQRDHFSVLDDADDFALRF